MGYTHWNIKQVIRSGREGLKWLFAYFFKLSVTKDSTAVAVINNELYCTAIVWTQANV